MLEAYMKCDKPPPLDKLNPYRYENLIKYAIFANLNSHLFAGRTARTV